MTEAAGERSVKPRRRKPALASRVVATGLSAIALLDLAAVMAEPDDPKELVEVRPEGSPPAVPIQPPRRRITYIVVTRRHLSGAPVSSRPAVGVPDSKASLPRVNPRAQAPAAATPTSAAPATKPANTKTRGS